MLVYRIAKLDGRIGNCTVLACNKWQPIFAECETALGFSGDAAKDVFSAWSRLATDSFHKRTSDRGKQPSPIQPPRRSNSLTGLSGRTVKVPVQLIPLERARAMTSAASVDEVKLRHRSALVTSLSATSGDVQTTEDRPEISRPLNIEESTLCCSYPSGMSYRISLSPYAPQADLSEGSQSNVKEERPSSDTAIQRTERTEDKSDLEETISASFDMKETIRAYVDNVMQHIHVYVFSSTFKLIVCDCCVQAFNTPRHPMGILMNRLETVFKESYGGVGANKFLLPHAIAEVHSIIQRMHSIVRYNFHCVLYVAMSSQPLMTSAPQAYPHTHTHTHTFLFVGFCSPS